MGTAATRIGSAASRATLTTIDRASGRPPEHLREALYLDDVTNLTGPAFDPSGTRLYFSSQRGTGTGGITYEITGPFHEPA